MSSWNYVATAHKPTSVTHSCVGNFTSPRELNLIVAKCTRIEIHLVTPQGPQHMLDVPIYGRIANLELFRPRGEAQHSLFITTERYKFCLLQWDAESSELVTRAMGHFSGREGRPTDHSQICIIDPDCRLIGLHLYPGSFKVIPFDNKGLIEETFDIRLEELQVLDIKFLFGCVNPTVAVLYQDKKDARHVKTYKVSLENKAFFEGPWSQNNLDTGADLLIPVPPPLCGVLVIGKKTVVYRSDNAYKAIPTRSSITKAYGRVDDFRFLLGDHAGLIHLLSITHKNLKVTGLKIKLLGETSVASTISYLDNDLVFVGSSYGDSQLVKLNLHRDAKGSEVQVLERYYNLGPIVDLESQGQGQAVTCSGAFKDASLRVIRNGIGISEQASVEFDGIKGMWSLKSSIDQAFDTFLVISFIYETRILATNPEDELEEIELEGFLSQVQTLFCHDAVYNQLVQVAPNSVRLVSSITRQLQDEWHAPAGHSVSVATANASQVLLAAGAVDLFYLEIGDGKLTEVKHAVLEYEVSCLDINPIGDNPNFSQIALVGMWTDISVRIFSLPELTLITKEQLGGEIISRSVHLCAFEGISYVLCALGDGHLLNFQLDTTTWKLKDRKKVSLGTQPITLRKFSSKRATHVFAASDRPTVIYSSNKRLLYSNVDLNEVSHTCPFNTAAFPDCLAIAREGKLTIYTIGDIQKFNIRTIPLPLGEHARRICHQEQTRTFGICSLGNQTNADESKMHYVRLLDDQTFKFISTYPLDAFEYARSILSCSFTDDRNFYYCVGTAYVLPEDKEPTEGRILVFTVEEGKLQLIAEKETKGAVHSLNALNGKLLAAINQKIQLYKWILRDDGTRELKFECGHYGHILPLYVQTRGDLIVAGDLITSISLLIYKHKEGTIEERARDYSVNWMSAVEILDDDIYIGAENNLNLFTVKNSEGATDEERGQLKVVGEYHLGEFVNRFCQGSLALRLPHSEIGQIPTVIFGTVNGLIGVIASLPQEQYAFLEKLQSSLRKVIKGVGGLSHEQWRSFNNEKRTAEARNFLDGDLIESFLDLSWNKMEDISKSMNVQVEDLCKRVEELSRLSY